MIQGEGWRLKYKGWRMEGEGWRWKMESEGWGWSMKGYGYFIMEALHYLAPRLMLFLQISSSWVRIRLNTKNQLTRLSGIRLLLFYGAPIGVDFAYFINLANKVFRGKKTTTTYFLMEPLSYFISFPYFNFLWHLNN